MATRAPRPRRTRIYGANYNIGESLYKKQLDDLDNKRVPSRFSNVGDLNLRDTRSMPRVSFANNIEDDEFFQAPARKPFTLKSFEDDEPIKLNLKPYTPKIFLSHEMDDAVDNIKRDFGRKSLDISATEVKRSFISDVESDIHEKFAPLRSKFSHKIEEDHEVTASASASRMKATKARLADLETEMLSITEKQNEREKRNTRLKKLLNDADAIEA